MQVKKQISTKIPPEIVYVESETARGADSLPCSWCSTNRYLSAFNLPVKESLLFQQRRITLACGLVAEETSRAGGIHPLMISRLLAQTVGAVGQENGENFLFATVPGGPSAPALEQVRFSLVPISIFDYFFRAAIAACSWLRFFSTLKNRIRMAQSR